eukprot:jgi/Ulvmu1/4104/UM019_0083.1
MRTWTFKPVEGAPPLQAFSWETSSPKARLVFHHGYGEHCGRYDQVFSHFNEKGIDCHAYDMRTFGSSEPDPQNRGKFQSYEELVADLVAFASHVRENAEQPLPLFIAGSSMGALFAAHACLAQQSWFAGLLLWSPSLDVDMTAVMRVQSLLGGPLEAIAPWARIVEAVRVEDMSEDPQVRQDYVDDPLNYVGPVRVKTARKIEGAMKALKKQYPDFTLPVFGQHGSADKCTSFRGHKAFIDQVSSADKTLSIVEGGYHELLMGPQKEQCMTTIADWVLQHATPQVKTPL